eukprot:NODE_3_length_56144_cov_0.348184.p4 type:complete len:1773 gc:universal NODE_3_length_56144_cov_0.348184:44401-39083(-)
MAFLKEYNLEKKFLQHPKMSAFQLEPNIESAIIFRAQSHLQKPFPSYEHFYLLHHVYNVTEDDDHSKLVDLVLSGNCPFYMFKNISINLISSIQSKSCKCLLALYCSFANLPTKSVKCQQLAVQYFDDLMEHISSKQQVLSNELKLFLASCLEFQLIPKPYIMNLSRQIQYELPVPSSPSLLNVLLSGSPTVSKVDLKPSNIQEYLTEHSFNMKHVGIVLSKYICNPLEYQYDVIHKVIMNGNYDQIDILLLVDGIDIDIQSVNKSEADLVLDLLIELSEFVHMDFPLHLFVNKQWKNLNTQALYVLLLCIKELNLVNIKKITKYTLAQLYHDQYTQSYIGLHYFPLFENCMILGTNYYPHVLEDMIKKYTDLFLIGSIQFNEGYNLFSALIPQYLNHPFLHLLLNDSTSHLFMRTWLNELYKQSPTHLKRTLTSVYSEDPSIINDFIAITIPPLQYDLVCWFIDQSDLWFKEQIFAKKNEAMRHLIDLIQSKTSVTSTKNEQDLLLKCGPSSVIPFTVNNIRAIKNVLSGYKGFELNQSNQKFVLEAMDQLGNLQNQAPDIENEARALFSRLFRDLYPPSQLVDYLLNAGNSLLIKVVSLLLQEQAYFQQYPQQELEIASEFMGHLILKQAITGLLYNETSKLLVHCCKQNSNDKLFIFAHKVIILGSSVLSKDSNFMQQIQQIPNITTLLPELVKLPVYKPPPVYSTRPIKCNNHLITVNKNVLLNSPPAESIKEKMLFIINNLSPSNLEVKSNELKLILNPLLNSNNYNVLRFLAHYIVNRAINEPNFHSIYFNFIVSLCKSKKSTMYRSSVLFKCVLYESMHIANSLIDGNNKQLIRNSGAWIGLLTIRQDKPLIHIHVNLNQLIMQYTSNPMVLPFTCSLLQQSNKSTLFHLPNPFMNYHLQLLKMVHLNQTNSKGNLDIEILFSHLKIDINSIPDYVQPENLVPDTNTLPSDSAVDTSLSQAMTIALKEILIPVVERSVTIANISTRELISKDFKYCNNKQLINNAAILMIQSLAGSLAMVTCKEPLKQSVLLQLQNTNINHAELDGLIQQACAYIENEAKQQALQSLDIDSYMVSSSASNIDLPDGLQSTGGITELQYSIYMGWDSNNTNTTPIHPNTSNITPTVSSMTQPGNPLIALTSLIITEVLDDVHDVINNNKLKQLLNEHSSNDVLLLEYIEWLILSLYSTEHGFIRQLSSVLLRDTIELNKVLIKEFTSWFYLQSNIKIFNLQCIYELLQVGLIRLGDVSIAIIGLISNTTTANVALSKSFLTSLVNMLVESEENDYLLVELHMSATMLSCYSVHQLLQWDLSHVDLIFVKWCKLTLMTHWSLEIKNEFMSMVINIINTDEKIIYFTRSALEMALDYNGNEFNSIDALVLLLVEILAIKCKEDKHVQLFSKLVATISMVLVHEYQTSSINKSSKFTRLFSLLQTMIHDHELLKVDFNSMSLLETLHVLQPQIVPGFTFGWLCLISHRQFIPNMLTTMTNWHHYHLLLVDLLVYLKPFTTTATMTEATRLLYKGTLRLFLVLLHDYPEFLCCYYYNLCLHIPPICIQLKNLLLSCFPRDLRLPDPFTPGLNIKELPEILIQPVVKNDYLSVIKSYKESIDGYLKNKQSTHVIADIMQSTDVVMNAVLFYMGCSEHKQEIRQSGQYELIKAVLNGLDSSKRYMAITCMANHLRYPNAHSYFFNRVLLGMFEDDTVLEVVKEQITRVLLERLIANRPHPWCLLTTFVELIKNPKYSFWTLGFTRCAPDIERLFESVARSIS